MRRSMSGPGEPDRSGAVSRTTLAGLAVAVGVGLAVALTLVGCGAADQDLDPAMLDPRDLLGVTPAAAATWDAGQRAAAREVLAQAWRATAAQADARALAGGPDGGPAATTPGDPATAAPGPSVELHGRVDTAALIRLDRLRQARGLPPIIAGRGAVQGLALTVAVTAPMALGATSDGSGPPLRPDGWDPGDAGLLDRGRALLGQLAEAAGHPAGAQLIVRPAPSAPFGAVYLGQRAGMLVNPVLLAALEPVGDGDPSNPASGAPAQPARGAPGNPAGAASLAHSGAAGVPGQTAPPAEVSPESGPGGNPYSFFGSVAECAAYQRNRCEACLPDGSCDRTSRDAQDGNDECQTLSQGDGRGYYLYCANLSLAIATVASCTADQAPGCPQVNGASNQLAQLDANATFIDDDTCQAGLDECLAQLYGSPDQTFPPPPTDAGPGGADAGPTSSPPEPRQVSCGESSTNCDFSPQCDSSCETSCDQNGSCGGDCNGSDNGCGSCSDNGCSSSDSGGSGGSSGCGSGCGSDSGGSSSGDSSGCGSGCGSDSGGGGGGDSGGGGCGSGSGCSGGSSCGGGDGCSGGSSGSGNSNCSVAGPARRAGGGPLLALLWALMPLPYLERRRRLAERDARRRRHAGGTTGESTTGCSHGAGRDDR